MASDHAMFASEVIDKSTAPDAGDDDPADLTFADGSNVAVISNCAEGLVDIATRRAKASGVLETPSIYLLRRNEAAGMVHRNPVSGNPSSHRGARAP
jgi:hypothetical protein